MPGAEREWASQRDARSRARVGSAARCPEPSASEHRSERQRARGGASAEATDGVERGAERARSRAVSTEAPGRDGAAYADRFAAETPALVSARTRAAGLAGAPP